jgi:thiol-disulfide isomerase/thioredoxin
MSQTADEISVRRKPAGIPSGVFVALLLVAFLYAGLRVARRPHLVGKGALAPSFTLEKYGGGRISLDELRGKVVLINFWATWCPPCVEEMPTLVKVAREYESQGLVLLAVNKDEAESAKAAVGVFVANRIPDLASHVVFADARMATNYRVQSLPTSYFIGRDGMVLDAQSGYLQERSLRKKIESALRANQ